MTTNLRILQLNIMKSQPGMEALINDSNTQNLDILLIQEPSTTAYRTHVNHSAWRLYRPTYIGEDRRRSLLYVNRRISTSSHRQIDCNHPDITAVKVWTSNSQVLIFSVYIPPAGIFQHAEEVSIQSTLDIIQSTITQAGGTTNKPTSIILAGDFNRHYPAWSNREIHPQMMRHSIELIEFFQRLDCRWCLPRGSQTFWSLNQPWKTSTIDLTVTDSPEKLVKCHLYHDHYGSDHRATYSEWTFQPRHTPARKPRKAYEHANWESIGQEVQNEMQQQPPLSTRQELDLAVQKLITNTTSAIERHVPSLRPSPYSKRWFTPELKRQQRSVNRTRRRWQRSCALRGAQDPTSKALFKDMCWKRRQWTKAILKAKATHWKNFLDTAGEGHLWKAATYMTARDSYANIPTLLVGTEEITDNEAKAETLMSSFFPAMPRPTAEQLAPQRGEILWQPITEAEIRRAVQTAKGTTAPGEDGIPTLVWKQLWEYIGKPVTAIFTASIELGHYPQQWKQARIIVLRKPGKTDYSVPAAYRPISLLNTLGKLLEAVMAKRLSYYAETYNLLPNTQFGGRPGRNTEQALLVLANELGRAWLRMKVITLVAFDLKGAFNGVNQTSLDSRLRDKGIPDIARKWIWSFMEGRRASIGFDDFESEVAPLENAGLAQGSPLSPVLFAFFNSDLVDQPVDCQGGASAFIDDYFRWRAGRSAEENIKKIQEEDISRIETWAQRTGSCFAAEKTELIHITRKKSEHNKGQILIQGSTVRPSETAKLLGVVFDRELRWKAHVQQTIKRATKVNIAIGGLRHLRPGQMRQLYQACVTPIVDYASSVWHNPLRDETHLRTLDIVQRTALIRILSAFRTVSTKALEVEAHVLPTRLRLKQRAQNGVASLCTLPASHPAHQVVARAKRRSRATDGRPRYPLAETIRTMNLERLRALETIDHRPRAPWRPPAFAEIEIEQDREVASAKAMALERIDDVVLYSDASANQQHLGAAAVALDRNQHIIGSRQVGVGKPEHWSIHAAELIGVHRAVDLITTLVCRERHPGIIPEKPVTILSDSKSALQAIAKPSRKSGQRIVHSILNNVETLKTQKIQVRLQWIPGHSDHAGNDTADRLAKEAVKLQRSHPFWNLLSRERGFIQAQIIREWGEEWRSSKKGSHLRQIDSRLPAKHARRTYDSLPRNRAYLLSQLRTGHSWLSDYRKQRGFIEDDRCECGATESIKHVLVDCPALRATRSILRKEIGDAFNDVSTMLGRKKSNSGGLTSHDIIKAVLDFAETSRRFHSRASRRL